MTKDLLSIDQLTRDDLNELFRIADMCQTNARYRPLEGKTVALIFQKPSLRTRVSFEVAVYHLGGHPVFLSQEVVGIGIREKASDVAMILSRYNEAIVARLYDHQILRDLADNSTVPVINALTDLSHPCQVIADVYTLRQHRKLKRDVKIAFVGDGNNVVNSWLEMSMLVPMHFVLACPKGYEPHAAILNRAIKSDSSNIEILHDPREAVKDADVIYTDVWTSMGQEREMAKRKKDFSGFHIDAALVGLAHPDAVVMHCLPAHRDEEISSDVLDGKQSIVFDQAENRLHVQKAILAKLVSQSISAKHSHQHHTDDVTYDE